MSEVLTLRRNPLLWQVPLFLAAWLCLVEIAVRVFLVSPSTVPYDPVLGWRWPANATFRTETNDAGFRRVQVNALGFNDDAIGGKNGRRRFVVLGDSYVESFQLPRPDNFLHIVDRDMPSVQLVNAGRSGLDPLSESIVLQRLEASVAPDGVLMVISTGDESDMLGAQVMVRPCANGTGICDYRLGAQHEGRVKQLLKPLMARSALVTYLLRKFNAQLDVPFLKSRPTKAAGGGRGAGDAAWIALRPTEIRDLLRLVFARITACHPLLVVFVPALIYGPGGQAALPTPAPFIRETADAAHAAGADFLDAGAALAEAYRRTGQPPAGFDFNIVGAGHLNALGHRALASAIEPRLTRLQNRPAAP